MRKNDYSIEEMPQISSEFNDREKIITEYKEMEGIETITEEEMTDLFGSRFFDKNLYFYHPESFGTNVRFYISDYEQYQLENGYDPILGEYIEQIEFELYYYQFEEMESLHILDDISDID